MKSAWKDILSNRIFRVTVGLILILALNGVAWGEGEGEKKRILGLKQLVDMALAKSPELEETRSEILSARKDLEQAEAGNYPRLESVGIAGPVKDAELPVIVGRRIHDPSPGLSLSSIGVFGRFDFTVAQPLYTFGKISNRKEAATRGVRARELKLTEKRNDIAFRVKELYYALIVARAGVEASNEADDFFDDARSRMKRLLDAGSTNVMESDLYRIDAYRADSLRSRAEAEKGAKLAYFALRSLIDLPEGVEFDVPEKSLSVKDEELPDLKNQVQKALANRPELQQVDEALAAQAYQVKAVRSDGYPSFFVALVGSLAGAPGRKALHNPYIGDDFNRTDVGLVAGLKWDFDFGFGPRVSKERAEYEKLIHTKASGVLNIPIQVAKIYQELQEWKVAIKTYDQAAVASRKWVVTALADFDMGIGTADDMLRAIEKYGYNRGKYIEAIFNYHVSRAALDVATGVTNG